MLLALATLASAAPEKLAKAGDQAAEKQTAEQKRSRSKGQAHTGGTTR